MATGHRCCTHGPWQTGLLVLPTRCAGLCTLRARLRCRSAAATRVEGSMRRPRRWSASSVHRGSSAADWGPMCRARASSARVAGSGSAGRPPNGAPDGAQLGGGGGQARSTRPAVALVRRGGTVQGAAAAATATAHAFPAATVCKQRRPRRATGAALQGDSGAAARTAQVARWESGLCLVAPCALRNQRRPAQRRHLHLLRTSACTGALQANFCRLSFFEYWPSRSQFVTAGRYLT